jgi:hypothetical protein
MRIIRVSGCHDCACTFTNPNPPAFEHIDKQLFYCDRIYEDGAWVDITKHYKKPKSFHDDCPLEEVIQNASFDFLDELGEDIYTECDGQLITFKNKDKSAK